MLDELSRLADQIAALRDYVARCDDRAEVAILAPLITPLTAALDDLAEQDGMLCGDMPWWTEGRMGRS